MSRNIFSLPIRSVSATTSKAPQWICRRCLVTSEQAISGPTGLSPQSEAGFSPSGKQTRREIASDRRPRKVQAKLEQILRKPLGKGTSISDQYLQHTSFPFLPKDEQEQRKKTTPHKKIVGVVVSAGLMDKTVKVRVAGQKWNSHLKKYLRDDENHLVHDPNNSLVIGDVVELHRLRCSKHVHHVVGRIVSPFGKPVEARPLIPTPDERLAIYKQARFAKLERRRLRQQAAIGDGQAIAKLKEMGLDPGFGVEEGKSKAQILKEHPSAVVGAKGQILPKGVQADGGHAAQDISVTKDKAEAFEQKAEERLEEEQEATKDVRENEFVREVKP